MKKKILKSVSLLIVMAMLACGCGKGDSDVDNSGKATLTLWVPEVSGLDYDSCTETLFLEEKFDVDLKFDVYSSAADSGTLFNLMIAGEQYPDIFTCRYSAEQVRAASAAGAILPLDEYIVDGTAYKAALDANEEWKDMLTSNDGNIYNFPYTDVGVHKQSEYKMWYNADMMKNLGWENPPSTPEEFKQYLIDIRDKDANGNGDATDEIPLMGYNDGRKTNPVCFLMNPFELYTDDYFYITDDNEIHFSAVTDGWREGLRYIADLYSEGLIAEETYLQDESTYKGYLNKETPVVGVTPSWYLGSVSDYSVMDPFDYLALAPLSGNYQQTAASMGAEMNLGCMISTSCKYPNKAFEVLDYLISQEGGILGMWGVEGETFEYVEAENYLGTTPAIKLKVEEMGKYIWSGSTHPRIDSEELRYASYKDEALYAYDNTYVLLSAARVYEPYYVSHNTPNIVWCDDDDLNQERSDLRAQIREYIKTSTTQFILGKLDVNDDKVWKNYLSDLDKLGLDRYIEVLSEYYGLK